MLCSNTRKEQGNKPPQRRQLEPELSLRLKTQCVCLCCIWKVTGFSILPHREVVLNCMSFNYNMASKRTHGEIDLDWVFHLILGVASVVIP